MPIPTSVPEQGARATRPLFRKLLALPLILPLCVACNGDGLKPQPLVDPNELYWALELNEHAVTLSTKAPYDTLTLTAIARNVAREPLTNASAVQYTTGNSNYVQVSQDGVLHAVAVTPDCCYSDFLVPVVATLTMGNLKHADTVYVKVVGADSLPVLGALSIHPVPPDSAKAPTSTFAFARSCFDLPIMHDINSFLCPTQHAVRLVDTEGRSLQVPVGFTSSDRTIAFVGNYGGSAVLPGEIYGRRPGSVIFYARTTVLGITKADTLPFRIGWPLYRDMQVLDGLEPETKLAVGGIVRWRWGTPTDSPKDFVFTDPTNVMALNAGPAPSFLPGWWFGGLCSDPTYCDAGGGNFTFSGDMADATRRFPVPGTYEYHSAALGASARIVVIDEP